MDEDKAYEQYVELYSWLCGAFEAVAHDGPLADLESRQDMTSDQARDFANAVIEHFRAAGWADPVPAEEHDARMRAWIASLPGAKQVDDNRWEIRAGNEKKPN